MGYHYALIRNVSPNYKKCISDHPLHSQLDLNRARQQHAGYVKLLQELDIEVIHLEGDPQYPDCCFVEDTAVVHRGQAVISRMGAPSRRGEVEAISSILSSHMPTERIQDPGTLEGGDILHIEEKDLLICGDTQRTNEHGIQQLGEKLNCNVEIITDKSIVHLKSYMTYLGRETIFVTTQYHNHHVIDDFQKILVPKGEAYAANALNVNDNIIIPQGYPMTEKLLRENGFDVYTLDVSEFQKCEGALTCLSILF